MKRKHRNESELLACVYSTLHACTGAAFSLANFIKYQDNLSHLRTAAAALVSMQCGMAEVAEAMGVGADPNGIPLAVVRHMVDQRCTEEELLDRKDGSA